MPCTDLGWVGRICSIYHMYARISNDADRCRPLDTAANPAGGGSSFGDLLFLDQNWHAILEGSIRSGPCSISQTVRPCASGESLGQAMCLHLVAYRTQWMATSIRSSHALPPAAKEVDANAIHVVAQVPAVGPVQLANSESRALVSCALP